MKSLTVFIFVFSLSHVFAHGGHHHHHHPHKPLTCKEDPNCLEEVIFGGVHTDEKACRKDLIIVKKFVIALKSLLGTGIDWLEQYDDGVKISNNCSVVDQRMYYCRKLSIKKHPVLVKKSREALKACSDFYDEFL